MEWGSGRRRALAAAFPFVFMFGLIAILARAQAVETTGPWFSPPVTEVFYAVTLVSAVLLTLVTAFWATHRRSVLDDRIRGINLRLAVVRASFTNGGVEVSMTSTRPEPMTPAGPQDQPAMAAGMFQESEVPFVSIQETASAGSTKASLEVEEQELQSVLKTWRAQRDSIWPFVTGPLSISILYAIIAGTLLPGAEGFLTWNFHLNTMLILFIGYSWWLLLAWLVVGLASQGREPRRAKAPRTTP